MTFGQKRRLSIFSHWLIMERSQNWTDLRSPISKFREIHFVYHYYNYCIHYVYCVYCCFISCSKLQSDQSLGVAVTGIETFNVVRSLDVIWWPDLGWLWSEVFTEGVEKMYDKMCKTRRHSEPPFFRYSRETGGVVQTVPPPQCVGRAMWPRMKVLHTYARLPHLPTYAHPPI